MLYRYRDVKYLDSRDAVIVSKCAGKRVLHIGAADAPYTREKLEAGSLLHPKLEEVAAQTVGVDIDADAVDYLRSTGITTIRPEAIDSIDAIGFEPEIIVFGETIEHVDDVGLAVAELKSLMGPETSLLISTPNLLSFYNLVQVLRQRETQHPDHRVGFTYGLLRQLLEARGLEVTEAHFTFLESADRGLKGRIWRLAARLFRGFSQTLLFDCRLANAS